jgi:hypothetical protein
MKRLLVLAVLAAGALAPAAAAGGWATVQLSAVPTDGTKAGTKLPIDVTVLQHGRTPLEGVTPVVRIRNGDRKVVAVYRGEPTGRPGVYHVDVVFPQAGAATYEVYDGFETYGGAQTHTYAPIEIAPKGGGGDSVLWAPIVAGTALAAALAAGIALLVLRRPRQAPEAAPQA